MTGCLFILGASLALAGEKNGKKATHPRNLEAIKKTLDALLGQGKKLDEAGQALARLKAYRYLAEVPYEDFTLDEGFNKICLAGVKLCEKLGKLEHRPEKPADMSEEDFKVAFEGTSRSNLGWGLTTLSQAIDAWMFDSDPGNIQMLGHRRWCISPYMKKTGLARAGVFTGMYIFDRGRSNVPDFDYVAFPARGYMPAEFFSAKHAWNVSLNPKKFKTPPKDTKPQVTKLDKDMNKEGEPLKLNFAKVDTFPFGIPNCIIFRPDNAAVTAGARYLVEIEGIQPHGKDAPVTLSYVVEFVKWK
jgi:hypothetical protein